MANGSKSNYRWYILTLASITHTFAAAMPWMCMPVLFKEISEDLGLSLVQIGAVWGMIPLSGIFGVFIGGLLGDRFGVKRTLSVACLLAGLAGALRGMSDGFISLMTTTFLFGFLIAMIPPNTHKTAGIWFTGRQFGMANGILTAGMGTGFTVGAMISATILSPLLGGWRNVLFLYGAISIIISLMWLLTVRQPGRAGSADSGGTLPLRQAASRVFRIKAVWLLGLTLLGYTGCVQGMSGYLPLYLREVGWVAASADGTLAAFNGVSTIGAIPLALLSDRLGLRKAVLFPVAVMTIVGVALLSVVDNAIVWVLVIMVGMARDGLIALCITMAVETEGVGVMYAGTALGLMHALSRIGPFLSSPLGNSLADNNLGLPFVFWAALAVGPILGLRFVKETGWRKRGIS